MTVTNNDCLGADLLRSTREAEGDLEGDGLGRECIRMNEGASRLSRGGGE